MLAIRKSNSPLAKEANMEKEPERKLYRALWYAWQLPELNRHQATLEQSDNPLVDLAYQTIQGGRKALSGAVQAGDPVLLDFLDKVYGYPPGDKLQALLIEKAKNNAEGIWPGREPVMVAPAIEDTFGEFAGRADHICRTWFETYGNQAGPQGTALTRTGHHWRQGKQREGHPVMYCQGCYEKRVRRIVNQVVYEAKNWRCDLYISRMMHSDAKRAIARCKQQDKRNAKDKKATTTVYKLLPQRMGFFCDTALIHNRPQDIGGEPIPTTRIELFDLLSEYCQTPDGKRISGSASFGGAYQGNKGNGRKKVDGGNDADNTRQIVIQAKDHSTHQKVMIDASLMERGKQYGKQVYRKGVTWPMYIEVLDAAGMNYNVTEGAELLAKLLGTEKRTDLGTGQQDSLSPVPKSVRNGATPPQQAAFEAVFGEAKR
jgi:hypothetical protein